jgi:sporadic carbohydrate cluster protein (TIGR04323 family)
LGSNHNNTYRGYVTSRPFGGFVMPVPAQNACMREYVRLREGIYVPPQLEHKFDNCFMQFFGTLRASNYEDIIIMYSLEMIIHGYKKLSPFLSEALERKTKFCFVLENIEIFTFNQFEEQHRALVLRSLIIKEIDLSRRICSR